jgi:hypothetical protein
LAKLILSTRPDQYAAVHSEDSAPHERVSRLRKIENGDEKGALSPQNIFQLFDI